jgi:hypothetical protein
VSQRHPPRTLPDAAIAQTDSPAHSVGAQDACAPANPNPHDAAVLRHGNHRIALSGRALHLILWLAAHHTTIDSVATESGQLWLTWKGSSVMGEIRTHL